MTKQENYEQVVRLTSEVYATNVAEKLFSAVKEKNQVKFDEVFEGFKKENTDLYQRIVAFGEAFNERVEKEAFGLKFMIFGEENKEEGVYLFDINTVNSLSLYALVLFANISDLYLFNIYTVSFKNFVTAIENAGYENLANFISCYNWKDWVGEKEQYPTLYDLLLTVFEGKFG